MAVRVDKYGHIIRDDNTNSQNNGTQPQARVDQREGSESIEPDRLFDLSNPTNRTLSNNMSGQSGRLEQTVPWYGNGFLFWIVTLLASAGIAYLSLYLSTLMFIYTGSGDMLDDVLSGLSYYAPYIIAVGSFIGCIWYNLKGTKKDKIYYTAGNYIVSPICACVGALGTGAIIFLIGLAITFLFVILAVVFAFALIGALLGG